MQGKYEKIIIDPPVELIDNIMKQQLVNRQNGIKKDILLVIDINNIDTNLRLIKLMRHNKFYRTTTIVVKQVEDHLESFNVQFNCIIMFKYVSIAIKNKIYKKYFNFTLEKEEFIQATDRLENYQVLINDDNYKKLVKYKV